MLTSGHTQPNTSPVRDVTLLSLYTKELSIHIYVYTYTLEILPLSLET